MLQCIAVTICAAYGMPLSGIIAVWIFAVLIESNNKN